MMNFTDQQIREWAYRYAFDNSMSELRTAFEDARTLEPQFQHGVNCLKIPHDRVKAGYLHAADDDTPYDVDGVSYCGRCHHVL